MGGRKIILYMYTFTSLEPEVNMVETFAYTLETWSGVHWYL